MVEICWVITQVLQEPRARFPLAFIVPIRGRNFEEFVEESTIRPPFFAVFEYRERPLVHSHEFYHW